MALKRRDGGGGLVIERHPVWPAPTPEGARALAERTGLGAAQAFEELVGLRAAQIEAEAADAFNFVNVPRIWTVVWSLLDWPYWPETVAAEALAEFGEKDLWAVMARIRKSLGFAAPVFRVWISGANGSGKTEVICYMVNGHMAAKEKQRIYVMSTSADGSVEAGLHEKLYKYIPVEWKDSGKTQTAYVSYKQQTGFAGAQYVFANASQMTMKFYTQEASREGEGFDADAIFPDESIPQEWFERLAARVGRRNGYIVHGNTPQEGYTPVVHYFMEGIIITRWATGHMLPRDGGGADVPGALGLSEAEYAELVAASSARPQRASRVPESRPENCWAWALGDGDGVLGRERMLKDAPVNEVEGRLFECVPRVGRCADGMSAVVWFHSADNGYGYPRNLLNEMSGGDVERIRCRLYGVVAPSQRSIFSAFRRERHVISADMMPADMTRYMVMDPAPGRNSFILWVGCVGNAKYVYREFPGGYILPEVGNAGPWARTSGRKRGVNDGERAEGSSSFGWGTTKYKAIMAWTEGWKAFEDWAEGVVAAGEAKLSDDGWPVDGAGNAIWPNEAVAREWDDNPDLAREPICARLMDPRGGEAPHVSAEGVSTPLGDYCEMGLRFEAARSGLVTSGVSAIISALDEGRLFVSEDCSNLIWALETWKNLDGEASATKDPIDCLRYIYTSDCEDTGVEENARSIPAGRAMSDRRRYAPSRSTGWDDFGGSKRAIVRTC